MGGASGLTSRDTCVYFLEIQKYHQPDFILHLLETDQPIKKDHFPVTCYQALTCCETAVTFDLWQPAQWPNF